MIKILIADDQELIRQSLLIILDSVPDFHVTDTAADGQEAIRCVKREKPDVILMDIRMPKMDGVICTQIIKEQYPDIKIIILTTFDDDMYVFNAIKYGASGYLLKGISMKELSEDDLVRVLTEPKNSLVKQYQKLLAMDGVELKFEKDALKELAKSALVRKTGARGLRAEMERLMTDIMYEAPGNAKMQKVTITKKMIEEL